MLELLRRRRSIRQFQPKPIDSDLLEQLQEALLRAPTSRNLKPCTFIMVDQPELLRQLARAKQHGSAFVAGAPLAVVICADETRSDVWIEDGAIAATTLHYQAQALNLGSCWIQLRGRAHSPSQSSEDFVQQLLGLPSHLRVVVMVAIGYPAESKPGHLADSLDRAALRRNGYDGGS